MVLALSQEKLDHHKPQKPSDIQALALLEDLGHSRKGAAETLDYLRSPEVGRDYLGEKAISYVSSALPRKAGFADYHSYVGVQKSRMRIDYHG